jgi:hypothetical protein
VARSGSSVPPPPLPPASPAAPARPPVAAGACGSLRWSAPAAVKAPGVLHGERNNELIRLAPGVLFAGVGGTGSGQRGVEGRVEGTESERK